MQSQISRQRKEDATVHVVEIISNARSPTLETVRKVEEVINKYSGKYNQREIWKKLPRKVMWQTYRLIIDYLQDINKIIIDNKDKVVYIWDPEMIKKYSTRRRLWEISK